MNEQTLTQFFDTNRPQLVRYAYSIVGDYDKATDVVSDAYLKAFRAIGTYKGDATKKGVTVWVNQVVRNTAISVVRREKIRYDVQLSILEKEPSRVDTGFDAIDNADRVRRAFKGLNATERQAVTLVADGATMNEVAESVGIPSATLRKIFNRLRNASTPRYRAVHAVAGIA